MAHSQKSLRDHARNRSHPMGAGYQGNPILALRLVEIRHGRSWYRYLTSVLEPNVLPPYVVADLYSRRWRIEESFPLLKRLLGLSYLWTNSINGIKLQLWATWLFSALTVPENQDLGIVKSTRPKRAKPPLNLSPFPS